jgi:hypothetical protein
VVRQRPLEIRERLRCESLRLAGSEGSLSDEHQRRSVGNVWRKLFARTRAGTPRDETALQRSMRAAAALRGDRAVDDKFGAGNVSGRIGG